MQKMQQRKTTLRKRILQKLLPIPIPTRKIQRRKQKMRKTIGILMIIAGAILWTISYANNCGPEQTCVATPWKIILFAALIIVGATLTALPKKKPEEEKQ